MSEKIKKKCPHCGSEQEITILDIILLDKDKNPTDTKHYFRCKICKKDVYVFQSRGTWRLDVVRDIRPHGNRKT